MNWIGMQIGNLKAQKRCRPEWFSVKESHDRMVRMYRKTTKLCSCWCCGNRRNFEGKTIQELKWNERAKEWMHGC